MGIDLGIRARSLLQRFSLADGLVGKGQAARATMRGRLGGDGTVPVPLRVRPLGGRTVWVRPQSTDLMNLGDYLRLELYLPPPEVRGEDLRHVVELGSNMGACLMGLAVTYAEARILGVEPDVGNFELAQRNLADFGDRVNMINAAIWHRDAQLVMTGRRQGRAWLHRARANGRGHAKLPPTRGLPIATLLSENLAEGEIVDYMHVSMEGAEPTAFETRDGPSGCDRSASKRTPTSVTTLRLALPNWRALGIALGRRLSFRISGSTPFALDPALPMTTGLT